MAAAVADFRPAAAATHKHKKDQGVPQLTLEATPDLLAALGAAKRAQQVLVGFALETGGDDVVERSCADKLVQKHLDLICGNRADVPGEGFHGERNRIYLRDRRGGRWLPEADKQTLARQILEHAAQLLLEVAQQRA